MNSPGKPIERSYEFPTAHISGMADATLNVLGKKSGEILIVGTHPTLNASKSVIGDGITSGNRFPFERRKHVVDQPAQVLQRIDRMLMLNRQRFPVVLAAFESHHFPSSNLADFINMLAELSHGTVVMADYTMRGQDPEKMQPHLCSRVEMILQAQYGSYDKWFHAHDVFTQDGLVTAFTASADWSSSRAYQYAHHKTGMIGSTQFSEDEMQILTRDL